MRKLAPLILAGLIAALAACDAERSTNTTEIHSNMLQVDEAPCGPETNRVCP